MRSQAEIEAAIAAVIKLRAAPGGLTDMKPGEVMMVALDAADKAAWRDMASAPKDGAWVELWDAVADGRFRPPVTVRQWRRDSVKDFYRWFDHLACHNPYGNYTAWRHLPSPPSEPA